LTTIEFGTELFVKIVIISDCDVLSYFSIIDHYELPIEGSARKYMEVRAASHFQVTERETKA